MDQDTDTGPDITMNTTTANDLATTNIDTTTTMINTTTVMNTTAMVESTVVTDSVTVMAQPLQTRECETHASISENYNTAQDFQQLNLNETASSHVELSTTNMDMNNSQNSNAMADVQPENSNGSTDDSIDSRSNTDYAQSADQPLDYNNVQNVNYYSQPGLVQQPNFSPGYNVMYQVNPNAYQQMHPQTVNRVLSPAYPQGINMNMPNMNLARRIPMTNMNMPVQSMMQQPEMMMANVNIQPQIVHSNVNMQPQIMHSNTTTMQPQIAHPNVNMQPQIAHPNVNMQPQMMHSNAITMQPQIMHPSIHPGLNMPPHVIYPNVNMQPHPMIIAASSLDVPPVLPVSIKGPFPGAVQVNINADVARTALQRPVHFLYRTSDDEDIVYEVHSVPSFLTPLGTTTPLTSQEYVPARSSYIRALQPKLHKYMDPDSAEFASQLYNQQQPAQQNQSESESTEDINSQNEQSHESVDVALQTDSMENVIAQTMQPDCADNNGKDDLSQIVFTPPKDTPIASSTLCVSPVVEKRLDAMQAVKTKEVLHDVVVELVTKTSKICRIENTSVEPHTSDLSTLNETDMSTSTKLADDVKRDEQLLTFDETGSGKNRERMNRKRQDLKVTRVLQEVNIKLAQHKQAQANALKKTSKVNRKLFYGRQPEETIEVISDKPKATSYQQEELDDMHGIEFLDEVVTDSNVSSDSSEQKFTNEGLSLVPLHDNEKQCLSMWKKMFEQTSFVNKLQNAFGKNAMFVVAGEQYDSPETKVYKNMEHVIELYNLTDFYSTSDLLKIFHNEAQLIQKCDDSHAILIAYSVQHARQALNFKHSVIKSRPMVQASPIATVFANRLNLLDYPVYEESSSESAESLPEDLEAKSVSLERITVQETKHGQLSPASNDDLVVDPCLDETFAATNQVFIRCARKPVCVIDCVTNKFSGGQVSPSKNWAYTYISSDAFARKLYKLFGSRATVVSSVGDYKKYNKVYDKMDYVIELYNIPNTYSINDILDIYAFEPSYVKMCDSSHALLVLESAEQASHALKINHHEIKSRSMVNASPVATLVACQYELHPAVAKNNVKTLMEGISAGTATSKWKLEEYYNEVVRIDPTPEPTNLDFAQGDSVEQAESVDENQASSALEKGQGEPSQQIESIDASDEAEIIESHKSEVPVDEPVDPSEEIKRAEEERKKAELDEALANWLPGVCYDSWF